MTIAQHAFADFHDLCVAAAGQQLGGIPGSHPSGTDQGDGLGFVALGQFGDLVQKFIWPATKPDRGSFGARGQA